jgi:hypothetical protein
VDTVACKLVRRDIIPNISGLHAIDQQVSDEIAEVLRRPADMFVSMQKCLHFSGVALVLDERVCPEHSFESFGRGASLVSKCTEMFEVGGDMAFVPCDQDHFDV